MKKGTFFLFLFCIIFMFSGVLVTVLGIGITRDYNEFVKTAKYTKGEIKEIITTRDSDGDASHDVYVKYIVDGEEYEVKSNYYTSSMYVGKEIGVYYDKNNPHKSKVAPTFYPQLTLLNGRKRGNLSIPLLFRVLALPRSFLP